MPTADRVSPAAPDFVQPTLLKRAATLVDVGNAATFLAFDLAAGITSTEISD